MAADLYRISYISTARREMSQSELDAILAIARERNASRDLTGVLIYHDQQFFQSIEGPRGEVDQVFARIAGDSRHHGCVILESRPVMQRLFSRWFMAFRQANELSPVQKQGMASLSDVHNHYAVHDPNGDNRTYILIDSFLSSFRDVEFA